MSIRIGVVADSRRGDMGVDLADQVEADYLSVDNGSLGCTGNHSQVWRTLAGLAEPDDWALVLEDDAVPVDGFREQIAKVLAIAPGPIVSLYLGQGYINDRNTAAVLNRADQLRANWIVTHGRIHHAVALAVRGDLLPDLLDNLPRDKSAIDSSLSLWARRQGHRVAYTWPSLVEHSDKPSLVTRYSRAERHAWRIGERDQWNDKVIAMV